MNARWKTITAVVAVGAVWTAATVLAVSVLYQDTIPITIEAEPNEPDDPAVEVWHEAPDHLVLNADNDYTETFAVKLYNPTNTAIEGNWSVAMHPVDAFAIEFSPIEQSIPSEEYVETDITVSATDGHDPGDYDLTIMFETQAHD